MTTKSATPPTDPVGVRRALGYLGMEEVAILLDVAPSTLRNRISIGTAPPSYKVGNRHLFDAKELQAWIRRRRFERRAA